MALDFLLDEDNDITIINGDFKIGESLSQEVILILKASQGEFKNDPLIGANLVHLINSEVDNDVMKTKVKLHLERDGKNYNEIKEYINLNRD